jgi:hypothetical protein
MEILFQLEHNSVFDYTKHIGIVAIIKRGLCSFFLSFYTYYKMDCIHWPINLYSNHLILFYL